MHTKKAIVGSVLLVTILLCVTFASAVTVQTTLSTAQPGLFASSLSAPPAPVRQPAEFEPMQGVLIRYPFGISYDIIKEMAEDVNVVTIVASTSEETTVESQYESHGIDVGHCSYLIAATDTYWTRDYGPWFIINGDNQQGVVDFTYNRPRPNDDAIPGKYAANQSLPLYFMSLTHSGGNYMTDGQGIAISTNLVWEENSGLTHEQINQTVHDYLGITTYHVVPDVNGDYIKHIDCWGKYLSPDTIMIRQVPSSDSHYVQIEAAVAYFKNQTSCYGTPYHVVRVYTPQGEPYTNSLILNNKVFVPIMGDQWDDDALASYQAAMPGYEVLGFTGSWVSTDALHCRAMGITDRYMLYIEHTPLFGNQTSSTGYDIAATIIPYSGEPLITASTGVYWKADNGSWQFIQMQPQGNDVYHAVIPSQPDGTVVSYYIHAEDASGRTENHPYIGAPGAHTFLAFGGAVNHAPEKPQKPTGQIKGKTGANYTYSTMTTDLDGDKVYYLWDWGDGTNSSWLGPYDSGATATAQKSWSTKGTYAIKVKAKDIEGAESNWSDPLSVAMPQTQALGNPFLEKIMLWLSHLAMLIKDLRNWFGNP
ncbi:MAG TPA: agmatine deiminase family protein [Candidatus Thermoplasmatota archaeon]|nr:agmatine deiminase family protein [Candidatus Thermoplasmatota archaeon]